MRKLIILLLILSFCTSAHAIIYSVSTNENVPLGEKLIITGDYNESNVLCSFYIKDLNGITIERLSDEYTFSNGSFYSERVITEPPYFRTSDYNVIVMCENSRNDATFSVIQRRGVSDFFFGELFYFMGEGEMIVYFIAGLVIFVIIAGGVWALISNSFRYG